MIITTTDERGRTKKFIKEYRAKSYLVNGRKTFTGQSPNGYRFIYWDNSKSWIFAKRINNYEDIGIEGPSHTHIQVAKISEDAQCLCRLNTWSNLETIRTTHDIWLESNYELTVMFYASNRLIKTIQVEKKSNTPQNTCQKPRFQLSGHLKGFGPTTNTRMAQFLKHIDQELQDFHQSDAYDHEKFVEAQHQRALNFVLNDEIDIDNPFLQKPSKPSAPRKDAQQHTQDTTDEQGEEQQTVGEVFSKVMRLQPEYQKLIAATIEASLCKQKRDQD